MWEYTEKVQEYYRNPKNVGEIPDSNAVGEVGSLTCGDALKLYLKIDENGIIADAKAQTFGCGSAVAAASALTEMIIGKTVEEAEKITNDHIVDYLGGLPPQKIHCSVMGKEALEAALADYRGEEVQPHKHEKVVCKCYGTTEDKIREIIREHNVKSIEDIINHCKAGGGCGSCHDEIDRIIKEENPDTKAPETPAKKSNSTQLIIKINNAIENHIAEQLRKDNGDIELVNVEDYRVYVKLKGACKNCPSSGITLKNFVETTLKEHIDPNIEVIEV